MSVLRRPPSLGASRWAGSQKPHSLARMRPRSPPHRREIDADPRLACATQLFHSFFKTLVGKEVVVELKNGLQVVGLLQSVDHYLNVKLDAARAVDPVAFPHLSSVKNLFVRGSVLRYIKLAAKDVDAVLLQAAARREHASTAVARAG